VTIDPTINFAPAREVSPGILEEFYRSAFPNRANYLVKNWKWHYGGADISNLEKWPLVALAPGGEIVGHVSTIPTRFVVQGNTVEASWFVDYFVVPSARGRGVGGELIRRVMRAAPLMLAIGVSKYSLPIFRRYDWFEIAGTARLSKILRFRDFPSVRQSSAKSLVCAGIDPCVSGLVKLVGKIARVEGVTELVPSIPSKLLLGAKTANNALSLEWRAWNKRSLEWRLDRSRVGGQFLLHSVGDQCALSRVFRRNSILELHLLTVSENCTVSMFLYLLRWGVNNHIGRLSLVTNNEIIQRAARRCLFASNPLSPFFFSSDPAISTFITNTPPNWQMIDSDLDLALPDEWVA
jgi:hypothetical protein